MGDLQKIMGIATAGIQKVSGIAVASIQKVMGLTYPSAVSYISNGDICNEDMAVITDWAVGRALVPKKLLTANRA
jgi:hypothetical protein